MINQLRAGFVAQRHSTGLLVCLLAACAAAALYTYLQHQLAVGALAPAAVNGVQGVSDVLIVNLLGSLLIGIAVSRPFETKAVHDSLLASGRGVFVASTALIASLTVALIALPYGVAALVAQATGAQFEAAVPTTFALLSAAEAVPDGGGTGRAVAVALVAALGYAAKLAVCVPLAIVVRRPVVVMAVGFAWSFVADLLVSWAERWAWTDALAGLTPYAREHMPLPGSTAGELWGATAVSAGFVALMGVVAWLLFRRADVR